MNSNDALRALLSRVLDWEDAHAAFDAAVEGIPPEFRGELPKGAPHSPWQLLEHLRICQRDILE
ncbi:MAG: DinB family protein, partial [Thermoplasmata archaeon]